MAEKAIPKKKPSPLKRVKQSEKRKMRNQAVKTKIKTQINKMTTVLVGNDKDKVEELFKETLKVINSAASKRIIHRNTASRKISRIAKKINAFKAKVSASGASSQPEAS